MKKRLIFIAVAAAALLSLHAFNPVQEDFMSYVQRQIGRNTLTDDPLHRMFAGLADGVKSRALSQGAIRRDFFFFSIFEVPDPDTETAYKVLGFARQIFIPLNAGPKPSDIPIY